MNANILTDYQKKQAAKFRNLGYLATVLSLAPFIIDGLMQWAGVQAKADTILWKIIWIGICTIFNAALFFSSTIRHALGIKRLIWAAGAIPVIFLVSTATTMMSQSAFIKQQANAVADARQERNARFSLAKSLEQNGRQQTRIIHVSKSTDTLLLAAKELDKASATKVRSVTNEESAEIPLSIINAVLPSPITATTYLVIYYSLISCGLLIIGYFFGEARTACFDKAERIATGENTLETQPDTARHDSDTRKGPNAKEIKLAIREGHQRAREARQDLTESDMTRNWIQQACKDKYGIGRTGTYLDEFIPYAKRQLTPLRFLGI